MADAVRRRPRAMAAAPAAAPESPAAGGPGGTPRHVGIIMDGNGRWAKARGLPRRAGHARGVEALRRTLEAACDLGISYLTVYGFSAENWSRPQAEIDTLMDLLRRYLDSESARLVEQEVRFRAIGDRAGLPADIACRLDSLETATAAGRRGTFIVALNYGGRQEIAAAARRLAARVAAGELAPEAIDPAALAAGLETADIPDPDLIIRTSSEQRLSNFLLWQAAYTELWFTPVLWPDFGKAELSRAVADFAGRERRFGGAGEAGDG